MPGMMMDAALPRLTLGRVLTEWAFHPGSSLVLTLLLLSYLVGVRAARRRGAAWRHRDTSAWLAGIAVLTFATQGSPAVYEDALFWMHMVGHLLLIMAVPLLLVGGRPLGLALVATSPARSERLRAAFEGRVASTVTHPGSGLALYAVIIVGTHLTGFMDTMMMHPWLHGLEQVIYVVSGVVFFLPLIGDQPIRWKLAAPLRMAILVAAMPIDTFTGVILAQSTKYPWPMMAAAHPGWAPSLINDLHAGGAIMWVGGDAIMVSLFGVAAVGWARAAAAGDGSELGGWLNAARVNYHHDLVTAGAPTSSPEPSASHGAADDEAALAAYNAYLERLQRRPAADHSADGEGVARTGED